MRALNSKIGAVLGGSLALLLGCGDGSSDATSGDVTGDGGATATGGFASTTGGAASGGTSTATGATASGGFATGGASTGGDATGGATGGAATGGVSTGGTSTGGDATGGTSTGGTSTGGSTGGLTLCTPGTEKAIACNGDAQEFKQQTLGPYFVWNNPWSDYASDGTQCTWYTCNNGSMVGWGTEYNYNANHPNDVKSYASAVLGWHWSNANAALGLQVSGNDAIPCDWHYTVAVTGQTTMNVSYDLWLHSKSNPSWGETASDTPTDEVMIWFYKNNGAGPISADGKPELTADIAGAKWELHEGQIPGAWKVHSFVRTTNSTNGQSIDLNEFLQLLVAKGYLSSSRYLNGIEAGTEPFRGQGRLDVSSWGCALP